ncbi:MULTISPECIES: LysR family transcriptional regulator [Nocardioides]|uniref:LysR family transcriptional regulator n=1 Tax=Nocardioides TaxID=1839 RepID=UPI00032DB96C|nr:MULTISPECIES: LysR family transcriptional regulator [Nocardioides]EON25524.1 regulatory protein, LysR [Nocardioides sp. CF8]
MELRLLETFRAVARLGTISAAATELLTSQPALSRQIQQLERDLGLALFTRAGRRLELTAAGRRFLAAADSVVAAVDGATSLASSLAAGQLTRVRMAAPTTTLSDVLAPFLAELSPDDPLITVEESTYSQALAAVGTRVDMAILTAPPPRELASLLVAELPVWAYVCADHRLADRAQVALEDLAAERLILLDQSARPRRLLDDAMIAAGLAQHEPIECAHPQVAQALAAARRGVAVLSDDPRFDLVPVAIQTPGGRLTINLHAAWDHQHHAAAELRTLADRLRSFCAGRYANVNNGAVG